MIEHVKPQDIEARSFEIIATELADRGIAKVQNNFYIYCFIKFTDNILL